MPQTVSNQMLASDRLIEGLLAALLASVPKASLACLNLLDPVDRRTVVRRPRFTAANSVGRIRRPGDMLRHMRCLLDWDALLPPLREGHCQFVRIVSRPDGPTRKRRGAPGAFSVLICPAAGHSGDLAGLVVLAWDRGDPSEGTEPVDLMAAGTRAGGQIAAVLELCAHIAACQPSKAAA
jgi:hypothetical protein